MDRYNATLTAMCEVIEDAIANGLPASDVPNLVANTIDELEGRAELRFVVSHDAPARMKEAGGESREEYNMRVHGLREEDIE